MVPSNLCRFAVGTNLFIQPFYMGEQNKFEAKKIRRTKERVKDAETRSVCCV